MLKSRKPICVASADWHLEPYAWIRHPTLAGDAYYGLQQIVDLCLKVQCPLLAAGDLFDKTRPDAASVSFAMSQMSRMKSADLPVYFIQGQHEFSHNKTWLGLHDWPIHLHNRTAKLVGGITLAGLDYTRPDKLAERLAKFKDVQIMMCHQVWGNFMGSVRPDAVRVESVLPDSVPMMVTGDFHRHTSTCPIGSNLEILSPGSICLQTVDEPPDKAVFLIYDDLTFDSVPIKSRAIFKHQLITTENLKDFLAITGTGMLDPQENVPDNISKNIVYVEYDDSIPNAHHKIVEVIDDRAHLFLRPISRKLEDEVIEVSDVKSVIELGLEGNLAKLCQPDSDQYKIALRLLRSEDPVKELEQLEYEFTSPKQKEQSIQHE